MMADRHIAGGVVGWLLIAPPVGVSGWQVMAGIPIAGFASLLADADHPPTRLGRMWWARRLVQPWTEHRRETHSLTVGLGLALATALLSPWVGLAVGVGYLVGHVLLDWCTRHGVALLWPWRRRLYRAPWARFVRTGGLSEYVMVGVLGLVTAAVWFLIYRPD